MRGTRELGVSVHTGRRIVELDLDARTATDDAGETYSYERVAITTGGTPRRLRSDVDGVIYFRTLDDYRRLRALADEAERFLVIGGGFIGSEIAAALAMNTRSVTMVFPDPGIGARIFPAELSASVTEYYRERGVDVLAGTAVTAIERNGDTVRSWLAPKSGNLVDRLGRLTKPEEVAEELYLSVLTRPPEEDERREVADFLAAHGKDRTRALQDLAWALLASAEFRFNH